MSLSPFVTLASAIKAPSSRRSVSKVVAEIRSETERLDQARTRVERQKAWLQRRAERMWDIDQKVKVQKLALRLKRTPGLVVALLETTSHGCRYLLERWAYLIRAVDAKTFNGTLNPSDRVKALCLFGIERDEWELEGYPIDLPDFNRTEVGWHFQARNELKRMFTKEFKRIAELAQLLEVEDNEAHEKALAGEFSTKDRDQDLKHHERTVVACERRLKALERERAKAPDDPPSEVAETPTPHEAPLPETTPEPPTPDPLL